MSTPTTSFALVGNPKVYRRDTLAKVTGTKKFTSDIQPTDVGVAAATGFVYMGYVTCPYPNALDQEHRRQRGLRPPARSP